MILVILLSWITLKKATMWNRCSGMSYDANCDVTKLQEVNSQ